MNFINEVNTLGMLVIIYFGLALLVVFAASKASKYVDDIDTMTNIGGAIIGGVLLAGVTSLPEFVSTIYSTSTGQPGLAFGNIFGSNIFNFVLLAGLDLFFIKRYIFNGVDKSNKNTTLLIILAYIIVLLPLMFDIFLVSDFEEILLPSLFTRLSFVSLGLILIYFLNIKLNAGNSENTEIELDGKSETAHSFKTTLVLFVVSSVALIFLSLFLTSVTGRISEVGNLGQSFAGAIFLGIATSLPELTSVYVLVKLNNRNAAIANIVGSNMFNITILAVVDLISKYNIFLILLTDTSIQVNVAQLMIIGLINNIIFVYAITRKEVTNKLSYALPSIIILFNYFIYILLSL